MKQQRASRSFSLIAAVALGLGLSACASSQEAGESTLNSLTQQERAAGWQLLFNGESFDGWRGYRQDGMPGQWVIDDNAIHFTGEQGEQGGDIVTTQQYDNFELQLEWKIGECGNSGIFYRATEEGERVYHTGPEYQVLDNTCHPDAQNGPDRTAGANYALNPPSKDVTKPAGEWNHTRIAVHGNHVEHWLNGEKVVEYEFGSQAWQQGVTASKFNEWPGYGKAQRGHIALQDHGDPVWYRNIKIKPL